MVNIKLKMVIQNMKILPSGNYKNVLTSVMVFGRDFSDSVSLSNESKSSS